MRRLPETMPLLARLERIRRRRAIERAARRELQRSSYLAIRRVECRYRDGVLTLRGRLPSFFLKQVAQTAVALPLRDVAVVDNRLTVVPLHSGAAT